uniref:Transporter n=1 Tax=Globodera pallida TaxID=36090 RepID=A0A183C9Y5_GLOPA
MPGSINHDQTDRNSWGSSWQFLLACIGYAVGLSNIWRFPSLAYENGGGAFLVPYLTCSLLIGFPLLYLEMSLGQFCKAGPAVVYGWIRPAFQGVGWSMAMVSLLVGIYYNVIVAWSLIYIFIILTGRYSEIASCNSTYNTIYCASSLENARCARELNATGAFFFNKTCHFVTDRLAIALKNETFNALPAVSPAEEFFENYVLEKTQTMDSFGGLNMKMVIALGLAWLITVLVLIRGVEVMGKIAWLTGTTPYIIIVILFVRAVTLDGAEIGLDYYLLKPDVSAIFKAKTWRTAATQVCYSLAVGMGGLLSLSSFNSFHNDCFKDAFIITAADAISSIFGGTAVFSTLGFMAKQLNVSIDAVVQSGTGLAFIAYPEAMSRMPGWPWLWQLLFFLMIFILGVASHFGLAEVMCTALYDQFPAFRQYKSWLVIGVCLSCYLAGLSICSRAGIFYFNIFDDYAASFSMMLLVFLELILVAHIYGWHNYKKDIQAMMGQPRNLLSKFYGPSGLCIKYIYCYIAPVLLLIVFVFAFVQQVFTTRVTYGRDKRLYVFPAWSIVFGWFLSLVSWLFLPGLLLANAIKFMRQGKPLNEMLKLQPKWPSYERCNSGIMRKCNSGIMRKCNSGIMRKCNSGIMRKCNSSIMRKCNSGIMRKE